eukprot:3274706-Pyramimonas_sp.AAC.1
MGRSKDTQTWKRTEDRVVMSYSVDAEEFDRVAIFVQPPRIRFDGTSMQDELLSARVNELSAPGASATDVEIV